MYLRRIDQFVAGRNRYFLVLSVLIVCLSLFFPACRQPVNIEQDNLYGRWEIDKAERNGKETHYLRNGYFVINRDGSMTVNITGEEETDHFLLDNNKLIMADHRVFDIQSLQSDSLTMKFVMNNNTQFVFYMLKKKDNVQ